MKVSLSVAALALSASSALAMSPTEFNQWEYERKLREATAAAPVKLAHATRQPATAPRGALQARRKASKPQTTTVQVARQPVPIRQDSQVNLFTREETPTEFWLNQLPRSNTRHHEDSVTVSPQKAEVARLVDAVSDQYGLPRSLVHEHIRRESSYVVLARNPSSTAKGLTQVVRCSHAAIISRDCRSFSKGEHLRTASNARHNLQVGLAHIAAAHEAQPHWSARDLWRKCHVAGLANCGTSLDRAAQLYARTVGF